MTTRTGKIPAGKILAIFAIWTALGLLLSVHGGAGLFVGSECRDWRQAEGEIIESRVVEVPGAQRDGQVMCKAIVTYRFRPGDNWVRGSAIAADDDEILPREQAEVLVAGYPVGTRVHVFFDLEDTSRNMLRCNIKENARIEALIGVSVLIVVTLAGIKRFRTG